MVAAVDLDKQVMAKASTRVVVHPLVLLSVVDHYNRTSRSAKKRVVGVLLGQNNGKGHVNIANSFAVPFEEVERDSSVWFLDHNYIETMNTMFRKTNAKERIVGWYHTGPKLRSSDLEINELMKRFTTDPVLVIVDIRAERDPVGLPTDAFFAVEEIKDDGTATTKTFMHVPTEVEAEEAEEIGVEQLLREISDTNVGSLGNRVSDQIQSLRGLGSRLQEIKEYLGKVVAGDLPINHQILYSLQDIQNLKPVLHLTGSQPSSKAFAVKSNDQMLILYISSLIRTVISLHALIDNKVENAEREKGADRVPDEAGAGASATEVPVKLNGTNDGDASDKGHSGGPDNEKGL